MIHAQFVYQSGLITGVIVAGHAMCGVPGEDIVCAAVSAVVQTACIAMSEVAHVPSFVRINDRVGLCRLRLSGMAARDESAQCILNTLKVGLNAIMAAHPAAIRVTNICL